MQAFHKIKFHRLQSTVNKNLFSFMKHPLNIQIVKMDPWHLIGELSDTPSLPPQCIHILTEGAIQSDMVSFRAFS